MRHLITALTCIVLIAMFSGCPAGPRFLVVAPLGYQTDSLEYTVNASLQAVITVEFSEAVDLDSLVEGDNVILAAEDGTSMPFTIVPIDSRTIEIISDDQIVDLVTSAVIGGYFDLFLQRFGDPIYSLSGKKLHSGELEGEGAMWYTGFYFKTL